MEEKIKKYYPVENYTVKCRLYPNKTQAEQIDNMIDAVRLFHNAALHDILVNKNPAVLKPIQDKDNPDNTIHFIDFKAMKKADYLNALREKDPRIKRVPGAALSGMNSGAVADMQKAWEATGKHPIEHFGNKYVNKKGEKVTIGVRYFSEKYKCRSFTYQTSASNFIFTDNPKVIKFKIASRDYPIIDAVKMKGFNQKLRFDEACEMTFQGWLEELDKKVHVTVSKDNCNEYKLSILLPRVYKPINENVDRTDETGIDVGEIDIMTTYDGEQVKKYPSLDKVNKYIDRERRGVERFNRKLSRRYGPRNEKFRKDLAEAKKNGTPLPVPSKAYQEAELKCNKLNRKIVRQREDYYANAIMDVISRTNNISVEALRVKDMIEKKPKNVKTNKKT